MTLEQLNKILNPLNNNLDIHGGMTLSADTINAIKYKPVAIDGLPDEKTYIARYVKNKYLVNDHLVDLVKILEQRFIYYFYKMLVDISIEFTVVARYGTGKEDFVSSVIKVLNRVSYGRFQVAIDPRYSHMGKAILYFTIDQSQQLKLSDETIDSLISDLAIKPIDEFRLEVLQLSDNTLRQIKLYNDLMRIVQSVLHTKDQLHAGYSSYLLANTHLCLLMDVIGYDQLEEGMLEQTIDDPFSLSPTRFNTGLGDTYEQITNGTILSYLG